MKAKVITMSGIKMTIDDREVLVPEDTTILEAARKAGSYVPALCDHPDLKPIGSCKTYSAGVVFMTFHFAETPTNVLTNPALDPIAKIPELKVCAVKIEKVSRG